MPLLGLYFMVRNRGAILLLSLMRGHFISIGEPRAGGTHRSHSSSLSFCRRGIYKMFRDAVGAPDLTASYKVSKTSPWGS